MENTTKITPTNIADLKLPKAVVQSPSMVKVHLICSTPITMGMEMYQYTMEKARRFKEQSSKKEIPFRKYDEVIIHLI